MEHNEEQGTGSDPSSTNNNVNVENKADMIIGNNTTVNHYKTFNQIVVVKTDPASNGK